MIHLPYSFATVTCETWIGGISYFANLKALTHVRHGYGLVFRLPKSFATCETWIGGISYFANLKVSPHVRHG